MYPSLFIQGLSALTKRLHVQHDKCKQIQEELNRSLSGEHGELHVYSILKNLQKETTILQNVYVNGQQIDLLLLLPSFCVVFEVKNIKGKLRFMQNPRQLIRTNNDGSEDIFQSPESQLEQNIAAVQTFFEQHHIPIPIFYAIAFPFHNVSFIEVGKTPIVIGREVLNFVRNIGTYPAQINVTLVGNLLRRDSNPWHRFPLCDYYKIDVRDILCGPECPSCHTIPMKRVRYTWKCNQCGITNQSAHIQALIDYRMLISETITVREAKEYLGLRNRYEAIRMLNKHSLEKIGMNRSTKYKLKL
ncbi:nuclease-related domain-containing protein [Solibacillus sp. CAU 1738]|uniref:nuclease-related domain-containing protein n=1 Tax=Solibacillus sp. CAU 1738 TaxID=3140363 RepID=UPI0032603B7E